MVIAYAYMLYDEDQKTVQEPKNTGILLKKKLHNQSKNVTKEKGTIKSLKFFGYLILNQRLYIVANVLF